MFSQITEISLEFFFFFLVVCERKIEEKKFQPIFIPTNQEYTN